MGTSTKASAVAAYETERRQVLATRVPAEMAFFMLINTLGVALEYHYFRQRTPVLLPGFLTEVVICLIASLSVRRAPRWAFPIAIVSTYLLVLCTTFTVRLPRSEQPS